MPPDPPRLGVLRTPSLSTFINHHASKGPLLVKKNPPFKIPGYGPVGTRSIDTMSTNDIINYTKKNGRTQKSYVITSRYAFLQGYMRVGYSP